LFDYKCDIVRQKKNGGFGLIMPRKRYAERMWSITKTAVAMASVNAKTTVLIC
jgi:hypothetical protein